MSSVRVESAAITHIGPVRSVNEDNYLIGVKHKVDTNLNTEAYAEKRIYESFTCAVCDGMGSGSYGELASLVAVSTLAKYQKTNIRKTIDGYIKNANNLIYDLIRKEKNVRSGTTLALLNIQNNTAIAYNIGDSKVYLLRKGKLYQMSVDHVDKHDKSQLTKYIGIHSSEMDIKPYISKEVKVKRDDVFMLCSDGLTDAVSNDDIAEILAVDKEAATVMVKNLASASQDNGGKDNITVVVAKIV